MHLHVLPVSAYFYYHQVTQIVYNHPSFYLLHLPTLASVYTLGVYCTDMFI